jgi:hypothetical protein
MKARMLIPVLIVVAAMTACGGTNFSLLDFKAIVYQEGDLPEYDGVPGIQRMDREEDWNYDQWFQVQILNPEHSADLLADIILFTDKKELGRAYAEFPGGKLLQEIPGYAPPDIGEEIKGNKQEGLPGSYVITWTYRRCYALVNIAFTTGGNSPLTEAGLVQYATALDDRLVHSVCPI